MPDEKELTRTSKVLSLVLRHQPQLLGLRLDEQGWTSVKELLEKLNAKGFAVDRAALEQVVATNDKRRFAFNEDRSMIRASQGHSVKVDLGYAEAIPPAVLYHGTAEENLASILEKGLRKGERLHVHLSAEVQTATQVGQRHGKPVVLEVAAGKMHTDGYAFFRSANGVWLTEAVPAVYLRLH